MNDEPPPKSKVANALIGLAMCICSFVVAVQLGLHTLCGPGEGYGGGGSNADGVVFIIALIVIIASIAGAFTCLIWLLVELTRGR